MSAFHRKTRPTFQSALQCDKRRRSHFQMEWHTTWQWCLKLWDPILYQFLDSAVGGNWTQLLV